MNFDSDITIIGAGPAGLSFAKSLAKTGLKITIIESLSKEVLENPKEDGREIALTHVSKDILSELGVWDELDTSEKHYLRDAKVINGDSPYTLHFETPKFTTNNSENTLGYLVANNNIRRSLYNVVKEEGNIEIKDGIKVEKVSSNSDFARVHLSNGEVIHSKLLVSADSRFSVTRQQMGISADIHDFGRTVVVFRMKHTLSNEETATECFHYGRTLAILPLGSHQSSIVITLNSSRLKEFLGMSKDELELSIINQLDARLGKMELLGEKHVYPLVGVHANRFYAKRYTLIGDAAVGMHPVTAHGYNLGLESQKILSDLIINANKNSDDISSVSLLKKYSDKHRKKTLPIYYGTNAIVTLFTNETRPAKIARSFALHMGDKLPFFKQIVSKQLTG